MDIQQGPHSPCHDLGHPDTTQVMRCNGQHLLIIRAPPVVQDCSIGCEPRQASVLSSAAYHQRHPCPQSRPLCRAPSALGMADVLINPAQGSSSATQISYVHAARPSHALLTRDLPALQQQDIVLDASTGTRFAWRSSLFTFNLAKVSDLQDYASVTCPSKGDPHGLSWSPDGSYVATWPSGPVTASWLTASIPAPMQHILSVYSASNGARLHSIKLYGAIDQPVWSPDALQLAFWGEIVEGQGLRHGKPDVHLLDVTSGLTLKWQICWPEQNHWVRCHELQWSGNSQWLAACVGMADVDAQEVQDYYAFYEDLDNWPSDIHTTIIGCIQWRCPLWLDDQSGATWSRNTLADA